MGCDCDLGEGSRMGGSWVVIRWEGLWANVLKG